MAQPSAPPEPPSYYDAQRLQDDAPPSYESLYGEFRSLNTAQQFLVFVRKAFGVIVNTVAAAVLIAFLNIIPLSMVIIGSLNVDKCPIEPKIPVWLIVMGVMALLKSIINFVYRFRQLNDRPIAVRILESLMSIFVAIWFVLGATWVFPIYSKVHYNPTFGVLGWYCDQITFIYAFVVITVASCLLCLTCFCMFCCCCCICLKKPRSRPSTPTPAV